MLFSRTIFELTLYLPKTLVSSTQSPCFFSVFMLFLGCFYFPTPQSIFKISYFQIFKIYSFIILMLFSWTQKFLTRHNQKYLANPIPPLCSAFIQLHPFRRSLSARCFFTNKKEINQSTA